MTKAELMAWIERMPDDMTADPIEIREWETRENRPELQLWRSKRKYQWDVENTLTLRLNFRERFEGEFRRDLHKSIGQFYNVEKLL